MRYMKKVLITMMAVLLLGTAAVAQPLKIQEKDFDKFTRVSVEDNFVLRFYKSDSYAVKLKTDERIAEHVQAYVKNSTLYLILNEKDYSSELKKELRQKGAAVPVLEAEVYMPTFNSLVIKDKSVLMHCDMFYAETFTVTASDHSLVSQLNIECSTVEFKVSKNAQVTSNIKVASKLYLNASNSTQVSLTQNGGNTFISHAGSSYVDFKANVNSLEVEGAGGSESHISGNATLLSATGSGTTRIDAELLDVPEGSALLSGSAKCHVNVSDKLKVNLTSGSMLTFKRSPVFEIDRIVNSTLIKADDEKRK